MKWSKSAVLVRKRVVFRSFGENQERPGSTIYSELPKFWMRHAAYSVYRLKKEEEGANIDKDHLKQNSPSLAQHILGLPIAPDNSIFHVQLKIKLH